MAKKTKTIDIPTGQLSIKWNVPESVITRFASHMVIQQIEDYFKLSFFEVKPEIQIIPSDASIKEASADCVASIIVTPSKFLAITNIFNQQAELLKKKIEAISTNDSKQPS